LPRSPDGETVHAVLATGGWIGWGVVHRRRSEGGAWSEPTLLSSTASGHTALTRHPDGGVTATLLDANSPRLLTRELGPGGWGPLRVLWNLGHERIPSHDKGWVFNALEASGARIQEAVAVTVGTDDHAELRAFVVPG
jgi:hypothetical protein